MAKFRAGKTGRTRFGADTNLSNQNWTTSLDRTELDTSNFEGGSKRSWLTGLEQLAWTIGALWNAQQNQFSADPPGLYPRDDGVSMKLFPDQKQALIYWDMPTWMCSKSDMGVTVDGLVTFNASGKAQEDFVKVTGNAP